MKVALILTGQMRSFEDCAESIISEIVEPFDADVFVHTWSERGGAIKPKRSFHMPVSRAFLRQYFFPIFEAEIDSKLIRRFYPNAHVAIEEPMDISGPEAVGIRFVSPNMAVRGTVPNYYKIKSGFSLMAKHEAATGKAYDYVVRMRPDLKVALPDLPNIVSDNPERLITSHVPTEGNVSDRFACGPRDKMQQYCAVFDSISRFWTDPRYHGQPKWPFINEYLLARYLAEINLEPKVIRGKFDLRDHINMRERFLSILMSYLDDASASFDVELSAYAIMYALQSDCQYRLPDVIEKIRQKEGYEQGWSEVCRLVDGATQGNFRSLNAKLWEDFKTVPAMP